MQSQLYNGAWTVSYPIAAPPGPGGLAPGLSLDYSSRSLAGAGHHQLAGWGWDIGGLSYILHDLTPDGMGKYHLTLNGVTHELEEHGGYFYSAQDPFLKIRRPTASNPDYPVMEYFEYNNPFGTIDLPATSGLYNRDNLVWEVTTEGGITYHFEPALYVRDCSGGDWTPSRRCGWCIASPSGC
ncbi:hypothetical protein [Candidatus Amarolinea dominans]|uniref:hypothetical protein n=1 Tax=Candidatus Amarolinea dominans TaxID=3140696 RepID=UPI003136B041|nr:hypothetical protein [Anaerolineae bacterium]